MDEADIEDEFVKGTKLCAVVYSHRSPDKQMRLIDSFLSRGADINFQDANRQKNTVLHCCVDAGNEPVIEFLIKKGIDFFLRNSKGQTALDLAEVKKNSKILRLLGPHYRSGQITRREVILETSMKTVYEDIAANESCRWIKILKVNKTSTSEVLKLLGDEKFMEIYNTSFFLFVLSFSVKDKTEDIVGNLFESVEGSFAINKPCLIEVKTTNTVKLFFRNVGVLKFSVCDRKERNEDEIFRTFENVENILQYSLGEFDNLTRIRLNDKPVFNGKRLIDLAASSKNILLIRFLMIFEWDFEYKNDQKSARVMEIAAETGNEHSIRALLDLPFKLNEKNNHEYLSLPPRMSEVLGLKNNDGQTPIEIACTKGSSDVLKCFIQCGIDTKYSKNNELVELTWKEQRVNNLCLLLKADKPFPVSEDVKKSLKEWKKLPEMKQIVNERKIFHELIEKGELEKIKEILKGNHLKYFYDASNTSAIKKAFEALNFDVVAYLMSLGFKFGVNDKGSIRDYVKTLCNSDHEKYLQATKDYFKKDSMNFVHHLISHSTGESSTSGKIPELFKELAKIEEMQEVMKVLYSSQISIHFDMQSKSVENIYYHFIHKDLSEAMGIHNTFTSEIFIAGDRPDSEILGTLAHELTHMAMQQCFENECKPFEKYSREENIFQEIVNEYAKECEERTRSSTTMHALLKIVFTYGENKRAAELIVRRNHFIAQYSTEQVEKEYNEGIKQFDRLKSFYKEHVSPKLEELINNPVEARKLRDIQNMNRDHGFLVELVNTENFLSDDKLNKFDFIDNFSCNIQVIFSSYPRLTSLELFKFIKKKNNINNNEVSRRYIFLTSKFLKKNEQQSALLELLRYVEIKRLIIESDGSEKLEFWKKLLPRFKKEIKVLIIIIPETFNEFSKIPMSIKINEDKNYKYSWDCLNKTKQKELLSKKVNFQNQATTLEKIIPSAGEEREKLMNLLPLTDLLDNGKVIQVDSEELPFDEYDKYHFIHRKMLQTIQNKVEEFNTKRVNEIYEKAKRDKVMIIADDAGMGKSIILTHLSRTIKKHNSSCWIFRTNLTADVLKEYSQEKYEHLEKQKTDFDKALLKHCWANGKVLLFFDGVNEVKLDQKRTLEAIKNISKLTYGQLWLTTRNDFKDCLEKELQKVSLKLEKFSNQNQVEFLEKFWSQQFKSEGISLGGCFENDAKNLLMMLKSSLNDKDLNLIGVPLQTRMIAEIYCNQVMEWHKSNTEPSKRKLENIDLNGLYKQFINTKILLWISKNKDSVSNESADVMKHGWKRHQQLSIHHQFDEKTMKSLFEGRTQKRVSDNALQKMGLVYVKNYRYPKFAHQTYAEYFIADYVTDLILLKSKWNESRKEFVKRIFTKSNCELIRRFVNSILANHKKTLSNRILKTFFADNVQQFRVQLIHQTVKEDLTVLFNLTVTSLVILKINFEVQELKKLFQHAVEARTELKFKALLKFVGDKSNFKIVLFDTPSVFDKAVNSDYSFDELVDLVKRVNKFFVARKLFKLQEFPEKNSALFNKLATSFKTEEVRKLEELFSTFLNVKAKRGKKRKLENFLET